MTSWILSILLIGLTCFAVAWCLTGSTETARRVVRAILLFLIGGAILSVGAVFWAAGNAWLRSLPPSPPPTLQDTARTLGAGAFVIVMMILHLTSHRKRQAHPPEGTPEGRPDHVPPIRHFVRFKSKPMQVGPAPKRLLSEPGPKE
jgi:hypothetical protein